MAERPTEVCGKSPDLIEEQNRRENGNGEDTDSRDI